MIIRVVIGVVIGGCLGALMGYYGQCSSGTCPLTANPFRGAIYGGVMGALFSISFAGAKPTLSVTGDDIEPGAVSAVIHVNSAAEFERHVVNATLPCLADFYSDNCGPCRRLAPTIEKLADKYQGSAVVCKVSLDADSGLAQPYGIRGIPAVLFFSGGKEVERVVGLRKQVAYEKVLDSMIAEDHDNDGEI